MRRREHGMRRGQVGVGRRQVAVGRERLLHQRVQPRIVVERHHPSGGAAAVSAAGFTDTSGASAFFGTGRRMIVRPDAAARGERGQHAEAAARSPGFMANSNRVRETAAWPMRGPRARRCETPRSAMPRP